MKRLYRRQNAFMVLLVVAAFITLTIVVAQLINEKSYIDEHEKIYSWCKFRVLDTISQAPPLLSFMSRALPAEILPIAQDELVMSREGGSVNVDGVDIIQHEQTVGDF